MANHIGNSGEVQIGNNEVLEVLDFTLSEGVEIVDSSAIDDATDTHLAGTTNWSGSVNCFWDETDTNGQEAMTIGASVDLSLMPEGDAVPNIDFNGTATIESIERATARNSIVTASFTFTGTGVLTRTVLA